MKLILLMSIFLSSMNLFAQERVGNGEGLSEQRITTINEYLPYYIDFCLKGGCLMNRLDIETSKVLLNARKFGPKFSFISGNKNPGVFEEFGLNSLLKTTSEATADVKVNIDRLYENNQAITLEESLMIVVASYDLKSNQKSDINYINKLALAFNQSITTVQHSFDYPYIRYSLYTSNNVLNRTIIVNDGKFSFNLSKALFQSLKCRDKKDMKLKKISWGEINNCISIRIDAQLNCSVVGDHSFEIMFNVKKSVINFPGEIPKVELDQTETIKAIRLIHL